MDDRSLLQPKGLPQGIYFDLPNELYHKDPALSHSGMVKMLVHHYDYWAAGPLNKSYEKPKPTPGMQFGTRCHMYLLQPEEFKRNYRTIYDDFQQNKDKELVTNYEMAEIKESIRLLEPIRKKYLVNGYPEVSIIWIDPLTGLRCRIRIDYLRTFGGIDYKRSNDVQLSALGFFARKWGYDMQDVFYREGITRMKHLIKNKVPVKVSGCPDKAWLKAFASDPDTVFKFIFQRSVKPYVYENIDFDMDVADNAKVAVEDAKERYLYCLQKYGTESEWPAGEDSTSTMTMHHFPRRILDRGARPID